MRFSDNHAGMVIHGLLENKNALGKTAQNVQTAHVPTAGE